ncbi:MAG TPA: hypothetical protein VF179_21585, partial [Thermoanaerobaculia bacterium]|nr:hypothetical protein [Thermoanaerobaculia bacterium]
MRGRSRSGLSGFWILGILLGAVALFYFLGSRDLAPDGQPRQAASPSPSREEKAPARPRATSEPEADEEETRSSEVET